MSCVRPPRFQHAAARRRLLRSPSFSASTALFQHAAARRRLKGSRWLRLHLPSFNTQPPVGGCIYTAPVIQHPDVSTRSRP